MTAKDVIQMMQMLYHIEGLKLMSKVGTPVPLSQATKERQESVKEDVFYFDDKSPRKRFDTISYPILFSGYDPFDEFDKEDPVCESYMESLCAIDGLHIDLVFTENEEGKNTGWRIEVYDDETEFNEVIILDGEIML